MVKIAQISKYGLFSFFGLAIILFGFITTPQASYEKEDNDVIQSINQYLQTKYVSMYDNDSEYNLENELLKVQQLQSDLAYADLDSKLHQQAQTMLVQLSSAIYKNELENADFYVDAYLSTLYETDNAQSQYSGWNLYSMPYNDHQQMNTELWNQLTEQEKISFILSMKSILLKQQAEQYMPSTFYVLEKLEQSSHNNVANSAVKTLLYP
ncbi:D-alanine--D-alanine ligase [Solibacillus kalamii]|uniref:D-alanine--D-alanine ligase n=1 Tax=Solibacillus kalamii TaxID=1748298 RepID=A0ABX3ZFK1_9BACL|nr:D-alanine--D-alanine ligase [Solibacillus kalamii]